MNIGIVLSGGFGKGAYQIGALRALQEYIPMCDIKSMSCASIGALNGYAFATGNLDQAENMWRNVCNDGTRMLINQMLRSSLLQQNIMNLYDEQHLLCFPFYCALFDLMNRNVVYKDLAHVEGKTIPKYLRASVAMPIFNRSVSVNDVAYFDGGIVDNIPVFPLVKADLDYIICMYFDNTVHRFENTEFDKKVIKIAFPGDNAFKNSLVFKQESIDEMITGGYNKAKDVLEIVLAKGYDNLDYIYSTNEHLNSKNPSGYRITGDILITSVNRVTKKLTRRKIL